MSSPTDLTNDANESLQSAKDLRDDLVGSKIPHESSKHHWKRSRDSVRDALVHSKLALEQLLAHAKHSGQPIADDLKTAIAEVDHGLHALRQESSAQVVGVKDALQTYHRKMKETSSKSLDHAKACAYKGRDRAEETVHAHPFKTVGLAAGVGLLLGLVIGATRD